MPSQNNTYNQNNNNFAQQGAVNNAQGLNIFAMQLATTSILAGAPQRINGIPSNSLMYTSQQQVNPVSANGVFLNGSIGGNNLGYVNASTIIGGSITGVSLNIGSGFSVDSAGNAIAQNFSFKGGSIGGWQVSSNSIVSPNRNIVFDATNNRVVLYNNGVPQVVLQG